MDKYIGDTTLKLHAIMIITLFNIGATYSQSNHYHLLLNAGHYQILERDFGYSPLRYSGSTPAVSIGFIKANDKKTDELYFQFSTHTLKNQFTAKLEGIHASILTYTFYPNSRLPSGLKIGWSNSNELSTRNHSDALNFSPRFDFHTSFGPAIRYEYFFGKEKKFRFCAQGHFQLIGFVLQSSFVTSPPDPFLHDQSSFNAFLQSIRLFEPSSQHNFGFLNQLFYALSNGNELGIGYRFDYTSVVKSHRSQRAAGHYFLQLNYKI
jgi:hypothetical protein